MFTFDGWVTRVAFELHWALETRLHASALDSELMRTNEVRSCVITEESSEWVSIYTQFCNCLLMRIYVFVFWYEFDLTYFKS